MADLSRTACQVASAYQPGHGHEGKYCKVKCPVHGVSGSGASLSIGDKAAGGIYVNCWTRQCDFRVVLKALGVSNPPAGSGPWVRCGENGCKSDTASRVALYDHSDGGKRCVHRMKCAGPACTYPKCEGNQDKHIWGPGKPAGTHLLLWGADEPDNVLVIVEGEAAAAALVSHGVNSNGLTPVSWRGGAGKEEIAAWDRVKGRSVILWPDLDSQEQGLRAMEAAARRADSAGATSLYMVELSEMPDTGKDGADAADVDSETALSLLQNAPPYEIPDQAMQVKQVKQAERVEPLDQFGPQADMDFTSARALSATANAIRLLMLCPEEVMVALNEEGEAALRVCESETGLWRRSAVAKGVVIEQSMERWERYLLHPDHSPVLGSTQKARLKTWIGRSRSPLGHKAIEDSLSTALGVLESYDELDDLIKRGLLVCSESDVDAQKGYIGASNGVIDLADGTLLSAAEGRTKMIGKSAGCRYVQLAHVEITDAADAVQLLLGHLQIAERDWIEGFLGHAMWGSPDGWAWLVGPRSSGKTTLLEAAQTALGEYAFTIPRKMLSERVQSDHSEGMHLFTSGARLAVASDILSDVDMESGLIKGLATGDLSNERRAWGRIEGTGAEVSASMILGFNEGHLPKIPFTDEGFMRRLRLLRYSPIPASRKKPKSYRDSFKQIAAWREATLAWMVDCAMRHREIPDDTPGGKELLADVQRGAVGGDLYDWLTSAVVHTDSMNDRISTMDLWNGALKAAPDTSGTTAFGLSRNKFSRSVRQVFAIPPAKTARVGASRSQVWFGLRWQDEEQHEVQGELK